MRIGGPGVVLEDEQIQRFVHEQLAGVPLDGRSVCVIVPDGTRSCPLPLLLSAVRTALDGRVTRLTVLVALGTHAPMDAPALVEHLGPGIEARNHEWWDPDTFVSVGHDRRRTDRRAVAAACSISASRSGSTARSSSTT